MASFRGVAERAKLVRSQPAMELSPSPEANGHAVELPSGRPEALPEPSSPVRITGRRGALLRRALAIADMVGLALAFASAQLLFAEQRPEDNEIGTGTEFALFCLTLPGWFLLARVYGLYRRDEERTDHSTADDLVAVFHLVTVGAWGYFSLAWLTPLADPFPQKFLTFWALAILLVSGGRAAARALCRRRKAYLQNTVIVGAGDVGQLVARKLLRHPEYGLNLIGFVDSEPKQRSADLEHLTLLGSPRQLPELVPALRIERVVIAFSTEAAEEVMKLIAALKRRDVQIDIVPRFFELLTLNGGLHSVEGLPLLGLPSTRLSRSSLALKRALDMVLSAVGLVLLTPLLAILAAWIRLDSPGPILYRSWRVGGDGRRFRQFKFRTMDARFCRGEQYGGSGADEEFERILADPSRRAEFDRTHKLASDPRVTGTGRFLRRTSLDELPQLINVILGDISLVGPRAITVDEYVLYEHDAAEWEEVPLKLLPYWRIEGLRPGVTGYWQINGRSQTDYLERMRMDMAYVQSWSLGLDLLILAKTVRVLVSRAGAY